MEKKKIKKPGKIDGRIPFLELIRSKSEKQTKKKDKHQERYKNMALNS